MTPSVPAANVANVASRDAELRPEFAGGLRAAANHSHKVRRQFGIVVPDSSPHSTLARSVSAVVSLRPKEQMSWVHAGRIVALVQDVKPGRDRSVVAFPRESMSQCDSGIVPGSNLQFPVARSGATAFPGPAFVSSSDCELGPEASFDTQSVLLCGKLGPSHVAPPCGVVRGRQGLEFPPVPFILASGP